MNEINSSLKKSFIMRSITAVVMLAVCIPCIIFGDWAFFIMVAVFSVIAAHEYISAPSEKKFPWFIQLFVTVMFISFIYWIFFKGKGIFEGGNLLDPDGHFTMTSINVSTMGVTTLVLILFLFSICFKDFSINDVCYLFTMTVLVGVALQSVYFIRYCPEAIGTNSSGEPFKYSNQLATCLLFIYVAGGALISDAGAYAVGVLFGKHKMNPRISPKKTWEGFYGGIVFSMVFTISLAIICDLLGNPILAGIIDLDHWYYIVLISLVMALVSVLGDFLFSAIKRFYKVKDFGKLLPGHGGVLDRFDSILVTSLVTSLIILTIANFPFIAR